MPGPCANEIDPRQYEEVLEKPVSFCAATKEHYPLAGAKDAGCLEKLQFEAARNTAI
jgi:hypothetical protein